MFLGVNLENEIFLIIYILNISWSLYLSQWSVSSFAESFWCFFFSSNIEPLIFLTLSNQVLNVLDNSPNAGAEFSPTPIFNKNKQDQNNVTSQKKKKKQNQ